MQVLRLVIGVVILSVLLRTFIALGVVEPVVVVGKSMAPRLVERDRIVVDRASPAWRPLARWQRVVARLPNNATRLGIKRIVGLPGERVEFRGGDLWVDGDLVRKTLDQQLALRLLVHRESPEDRRWQIALGQSRWQEEGLRLQSGTGNAPAFLRYSGGLIYDDLAINADVTRQLNAVADLMLCGTLRLEGESRCEAILARGGQTLRLKFLPDAWQLSADQVDPSLLCTGRLDPAGTGGGRRFVFSLFDQQATVAIDEQPAVRVPLPPPGPISAPQQLALLALGEVTVRELTIYRDIYYERRPIDLAPTDPSGGWQLGPRRWFLVGDNQAVSLDSRSWRTGPAGLPEGLIVGRLAGD